MSKSISARPPVRIFRLTLLAFSALLFTGLIGCHTTPAASAVERPAQPVPLTVETFDEVWRIVHEHHFDTNFSGLDWTAVRERFRPRVAKARTMQQARDLMQEMLDLLKVSHLAIIPSDIAVELDDNGERTAQLEAADEESSGITGLHVRWSERQLLVTQVEANSPAAKAGVKPGWIITRIGSIQAKRILEKVPPKIGENRRLFLAWKKASGLLSGEPGSKVSIGFKNERDKTVRLELERIVTSGQPVQFGNLPVLYADLTSRTLRPSRDLRVGVIGFNMWMLPTAIAFNKAIDEHRQADGIIVELRGNVGGLVGMIIGAAGHFMSEPLSLGTMVTRDNRLKLFINPRIVDSSGKRVEPYSRPLAILVDEISASASEVFAGGLQQLGRARVFGHTSTGQAVPAIYDELPNGDLLYHPFGDFITDNGVRFEGRGVIPDQIIPLDRASLLAGKDPVLEAAIAWIKSKK